LRELDARNRTADLIEKTNFAWIELAQSSSYRLGATPMRPYHVLQSLARAEQATRPQFWTSSFAQTPPNFLASDGFRGIRKAPEAQLNGPAFAKLARLADRIDAVLSTSACRSPRTTNAR
jgi:hypothetical protein